MGILCQINLFEPTGGEYKPGGVVSGVIKYSVDEPTEFKKITVSLKGIGRLYIKDESRRRRNKHHVYRTNKVYVDDDNIVQEEVKKAPIGAQELNFNFKIPENIPPSFQYNINMPRYIVRCSIGYYIRIKFERPGWFTFAKHYRKCIRISSGITPKLSTAPCIYKEQKKLTQMFASKISIVNIKANIYNSVIAPGDKIIIEYEVNNDTNVIVKSVESKLVEVHKFSPNAHPNVHSYKDIPDTDSKTGAVNCGETQTNILEINVPLNLMTVDDARIVERSYFVSITAELPMPHRDAVLQIPVQIGNVNDKLEMSVYDEPPPSYWEVMGEVKKAGSESDDDDSDDEKGKNQEF